jgi:8-oxo-dGTP diphosphatase
MNAENRPLVGVALCVFRKTHNLLEVLLSRRKCKHANGMLGFPGGHLEYGESFANAALRELREECGMNLSTSWPVYWETVNTFYPEEKKHYVVVFMSVCFYAGEARQTEPLKHDEWSWYAWGPDLLGHNVMPGIERLLFSEKRPDDVYRPPVFDNDMLAIR